MTKNHFLKFAFLFFVSFHVYATAQYPDKIIYNGKEYPLNVNPLEHYFQENPEKRPKGGIISTALWRGYVATFEIINNELILKNIEIEISTGNRKYEWKSVMNEFINENSVFKIDWFIGLLIIPNGKMINYIHMGYGSTYENYLILEIRNGKFIKEKKMNYLEFTKFRERQFQLFKMTDEYNKIIEESLQEGYSIEFMDDFLRSYENDYLTILLNE